MKRDLGLIREILLKTEADEALVFPRRSARDVTRHVILLQEAGLLEADVRSIANGFRAICDSRLTWAGYEYLESVREACTHGREDRDPPILVSSVPKQPGLASGGFLRR
jgi:hypothetical protein